MEHPNLDNVKTLANLFSLLALDLAEFNIEADMSNGSKVKENNLCGTIACHAGWFNYIAQEKGEYSFSNSANNMANFFISYFLI